jgi:hypothetical protein
MATEAPTQPTQHLPLLYSELEPLNTNVHGKMKIRRIEKAPEVGKAHAIPATVDEFALLSRQFPIIFASGDNPVPLALMGLSEGSNLFLDENGKPHDDYLYIPAYIRRFPFLLAKLQPDSEELSLCFDPTVGAIGDFEEGDPLFTEDGEPSEATKAILQFCEQFEAAGQRTGAFIEELQKSGLLMEGEVSIELPGAPQPFIYRGFQMVDEEKLRELPGDQLRKFNKSGLLPLVYTHLLSLSLIRELFARQMQQGQGALPEQQQSAKA